MNDTPIIPMGGGADHTAAAERAFARPWQTHPGLSSDSRPSGLASAVLDRAENFLAAAGFDRGPWLAVIFACGILAWFALSDPWQWCAAIGAGIIIALADGGSTVGGWIYDPGKDRLCHARRGEGAFIDGAPIAAKPTGKSPPVAAIARGFLSPEEIAQVERRIDPHYQMVEIPRCAAEQYPRLALGENDVSSFGRTLPWDHAAGALWLNEAGGKCARRDGSEYRVDRYAEPGLFAASSPAIWEDFVARLEG